MDRTGRYCRSAGQRRGPGERLGRLGLRSGRDRSTAWFRLVAGLLARLRGIQVKVTDNGRLAARLRRDRASYPGVVGRCLEHWPDARAGAAVTWGFYFYDQFGP